MHLIYGFKNLKRNNMKATIEISDTCLTFFTLTNDDGQVVSWEDLTKDEQLLLLSSIKDFHKFFSKFIK